MAGDHAARDRHLFGAGPKRLLSLDGGGVRGVISVAFLERIEAILSAQAGENVRLGDWFDLIGGTSTGAIIATGLALGKTTADL
jgi:patatin-like phospholipase/acyl hydrolase